MHFYLLILVLGFVNPNAALTEEDERIEDEYGCRCVEYYQCDENNYIVEDGANLIDVRNNDQISCSGEKICCYFRDDSMYDENNEKRPIYMKEGIEDDKECGMPLPSIGVRVFTEDEDSTPRVGDYPWLARIFKKNADGEYEFRCTGSLIYSVVVLTAAHCVKAEEVDDLKVIVSSEIELNDEKAKEIFLAQVIRHPDYYSGAMHNDIAILLFKEELDVKNTPKINTICPASVSFALDENSKCFVAGWGEGNHGEESILRRVEVPIIDHDECEKRLKTTKLGDSFSLHESFVCAGGEKGKDACTGDAGSPLMCLVGDVFYQKGIVSWGVGCGEQDIPGVYTDVQKMNDWLIEVLQNELPNILPDTDPKEYLQST